MSPQIEIEMKYHLNDVQGLLQTLSTQEKYSYVKDIHNEDFYFSTMTLAEIRQTSTQQALWVDSFFRIRCLEGKYLFNAKTKSLDISGLEVNQETEIWLDAPYWEALCTFFEQRWGVVLPLSFPQLTDILSWIQFLESQGFHFIVEKSKQTKLFTRLEQDWELHLEVNYLPSLGHFLEVEILLEDIALKSAAIARIEEVFDEFESFLGKKENALYIDLLLSMAEENRLEGNRATRG